MKIFAGQSRDHVVVIASADAPGAHGYVDWEVYPGEELFGFSYEELARGGTFEVTDERWERFGDEVRAARHPTRKSA